MSRYDDERPRRHKSHRERRPQYSSDEDDYSPPRRAKPTSKDLVRSPRSLSVSSVEEVERDFPPGEKRYQRTTKIRKGVRSSSRQPKSRRYYEEEEAYYSDPRAGARKTHTKYNEDDRRARRSKRPEYTPESSLSRSPRRRKSLGDQALAALGLGGAAGALAGQKAKDHDRRDRHHDRSRSRSRGGHRRSRRHSSSSRSSSPEGPEKIAQAVKAALTAGAAEAFRARKEPGGWTGTKGKRIITAAVTAGGVDKLMDKDPDKHGKRHVIGSALAGLATNRIVNGPRSRSRSRGRGGRDSKHRRTRSESRGGGLGDLAAGGVLLTAGKKIFDTVRDKSRGRGRSRSSSVSSYDNRKGAKKRSRSVSAFAGRGLAALGLKDAASKIDPGSKGGRRHSSSSSEDDYDYRPGRGKGGGKAAYADSRDRDVSALPPPSNSQSLRTRSQIRNGDYSLREPHHYGDPETDSDSDLGSSSEEDKSLKKSLGKELITAGLATVATIHAAHSLHSSMEAREQRQKALYTGEITPEEARKAKHKARFQDAASIGIAALGVKGAISEWKEVKEKREEHNEMSEKMKRHKKKRDARRRKQQQLGMGIYGSSEPNLPTNSSMVSGPPQFHQGPYDPRPMSPRTPLYTDGNPYAAGGLPPSPGPGAGGFHGMPPPPGAMPGPPPQGGNFPPPPPGPPPAQY